jgi:hypothetical protein
VSAAVHVTREMVGTLLDIGTTVADLVINIAKHGIAAIGKIIDAAFALGNSLIDVVRDLTSLSAELLRDTVRATLDAGKTLVDLTIATMQTSYAYAKRLVEATIAAGAAIADVLGAALTAGYQVFRRTLVAVLDTLGPVGEVFEWIFEQAESATSTLWNIAMGALREIAGGVGAVVEMAAQTSIDLLETVIEAGVAAGATLEELLEASLALSDAALELLGQALYKAHFTVDAILIWADKDALEGLRHIVHGMLDAGAASADIVGALAHLTIDAAVVVVKEALTSGETIASLILASLLHPTDTLDNLVTALELAGHSITNIAKQCGELSEVQVDALLASLERLGKSAVDILAGFAEVSLGALTTAFAVILNWYGSYRELTDAERFEAERVYGSSMQLDKVRVAVLSPPVDLIEWANNERPFTTMYLINFASWDDVDMQTLIHELMHVWQAVVEGPFYMVEALHAQELGSGYNYGYQDNAQGRETGIGAEQALAAAAGLGAFNQEQQSQIIEHYWRRRYGPPVLDAQTHQPITLDWTVYLPYANAVQAAPA